MGHKMFAVAVAVTLAGVGPVSGGPNPDVKLAMHLVASEAYLSCEDLVPGSVEEINGQLSVAELAITDYCGYLLFLAYDLDACITGVEYFVTGWPMGRGSPFLASPTYCVEALVLGDPYEANGGIGAIAAFMGECIGDPTTHIAPFAYTFFDLSAHTSFLPILLNYGPSSYSYPNDPHNYVLGPGPYFPEDPTVEEKGCVIGNDGAEQSVLLIAPNGGEILQAGSTPPIEWESTGFENIRIEYTTDRGAVWQEIGIFSASARFLLWTVPDESSTECLIRVSDAADGEPADVSDAVFTIEYEYGRVLHVPSEYPTIQYGIYAAAPADTVVVAPGEYFESVDMKGGVVLRSQGRRDETVINGTGHLHAVTLIRALEPGARIEGLTLTGGDASGTSAEDQMGGGIIVVTSDCDIIDCVITSNRAAISGGGVALVAPGLVTVADCLVSENTAEAGGGIYFGGTSYITVLSSEIVDNIAIDIGGGAFCWVSSPELIHCVLARNTAQDGGGIHLSRDSHPILSHCTITHNAAPIGGGLTCNLNCWPRLENSMIVFSTQGAAVFCHQCSQPTLLCCDVFGNAGGDWVGCIESQQGASANFCDDPLFCCPSGGDYHLSPESPCANHPKCGLVGALGVGCTGPSVTERTTWSHLKQKFREPAE